MLIDQGNHFLKVLYVGYSFINNLLYSMIASYRLIIVHDYRLGRKSHNHPFIYPSGRALCVKPLITIFA